MDNVIFFPLNDVQAWIASGSGICPFCRGSSHLKPDHRRIYDVRCMDCGHEFDMCAGESALQCERWFEL